MAEIQGRIELAAGRNAAAREQFEQAIAGNLDPAMKFDALLGRAEAELQSNDTKAAEEDARASLEISKTLQRGLPFSHRTGLAWLMLGRVLQARGENEQAKTAFQSAIDHLANTVDADHPALIDAHRYMASNIARR